jgi:uncharacterized protein (DUF433 family)
MNQYKDHITSSPHIMLGKPCIKGTRITVEHIVKLLSEGVTPEELQNLYSSLTKEDILSCLSYAYAVLKSEDEMIG